MQYIITSNSTFKIYLLGKYSMINEYHVKIPGCKQFLNYEYTSCKTCLYDIENRILTVASLFGLQGFSNGLQNRGFVTRLISLTGYVIWELLDVFFLLMTRIPYGIDTNGQLKTKRIRPYTDRIGGFDTTRYNGVA